MGAKRHTHGLWNIIEEALINACVDNQRYVKCQYFECRCHSFTGCVKVHLVFVPKYENQRGQPVGSRLSTASATPHGVG